jgi:hypothetical protein
MVGVTVIVMLTVNQTIRVGCPRQTAKTLDGLKQAYPYALERGILMVGIQTTP